jgi:triphosphoribosyl-dephospho-CoA synthase
MWFMQVAEASELACIIEAGTFKPGNVYPGRKGYINFLVSAFVLRRTIERMLPQKIGVGTFIKEAVLDRKRMVPENTNLGIILLHVPLAVAASRGGDLEDNLDELVSSTTGDDAKECAEALMLSGAFLGTPETGPDLRHEKGAKDIGVNGMTLLDLFLLSSQWDTIASEWVNKFSITFSGAEILMSGGSVLQLYMDILSRYPDSLIRRRFGEEMAVKISGEAQNILRDFSLDNMKKWDEHLHKNGINPGTTADLVASSLFVALLKKEELLKRFLNDIGMFCP